MSDFTRFTNPFIYRILLAAALAAPAGFAADGVIEISQARALEGGITEMDQPGFPVTLSRTGAYLLTENLEVEEAGLTAIEIVAPTVDLDLNGFVIEGPVVCDFQERGDSCSGSVQGLGGWGVDVVFDGHGGKVHGGSIRGMGRGGIILATVGFTVSDMTIVGNGGEGIWSPGFGVMGAFLIESNVVTHNRSIGIDVSLSLVRNNTVFRNGSWGINAFKSNSVENTVSSNAGVGIQGSSANGLIRANVVAANTGAGIASASCLILDNVSAENGQEQLDMSAGVGEGGAGWGGNNLTRKGLPGQCGIGPCELFTPPAAPGSAFEVSPNTCNGALCDPPEPPIVQPL